MESRYLKAEEKVGKISEAMPKSLLLVEDEDKHAELIRKAFRESKSEWNIYRVATLKAALECLQEAETKPPFVVVADYHLPDGTGLDIAGEAKSPEELGFPLIILTGQGSEQLVVRSFKSGAMDYMVKQTEWLQELPWTVERVLREWDTITERKAAVEALQESEEKFRMMFENMSNAVAVYEAVDEGTDFIFKDFNRAGEMIDA
ncbi:DNA-binding transcriptional response regulator [Candidatus Methanophagaceae archaeon]|nr:DNA-binding transcriptional response regulator [Methanophagales archaeon]